MNRMYTALLPLFLLLASCKPAGDAAETAEIVPEAPAQTESAVTSRQPSRFDIYATVRLTSDLSHLSDSQKQMVVLLIDAAKIMDDLFWQQAYGDKEELLGSIADPKERRFAEINYGPWDRLAADQPFIEGVGPKPLGARFYPEDMSKQEFEAWAQEGKNGLYSLVRRDPQGGLILEPYSQAYKTELGQAAGLLRQASELASDP